MVNLLPDFSISFTRFASIYPVKKIIDLLILNSSKENRGGSKTDHLDDEFLIIFCSGMNSKPGSWIQLSKYINSYCKDGRNDRKVIR